MARCPRAHKTLTTVHRDKRMRVWSDVHIFDQTKHDLPRAAVIAFDTFGPEQQDVPKVLHRLHTALRRKRACLE